MRLLLDTQVALWWLVGSPRHRHHRGSIGHKDPFDRLLLATAQAEHLVLLTGDERLLRLTRLGPTLPVKPAV